MIAILTGLSGLACQELVVRVNGKNGLSASRSVLKFSADIADRRLDYGLRW